MRGWGGALLALVALTGCTARLEMLPVAGDGGVPQTTATPAPRAETASRSDPARGFPYPLDLEVIPTPTNHDATRNGNPVQFVVIHYTVISYDDTIRAFNNPASRVSAHYVVRGDGHVAEVVSPDDIAWHAGNNSYNDRSVGIEFELNDVTNPAFTESQYQAGALLTCAMSKRYGIPVDREHVIGHVEVPGSTHTDPGPTWNWPHFMYYVKLCAPPIAGNVRAEFVSQTPHPTIRTGATADVQVVLRNTGETTWRKGTPAEARIAVARNSDQFAFLAKGWVAPDRPAVQQEAIVAPGQTATFHFQVSGTIPGRYVIPLQGVIDGGSWMNDLGLYTVVTVQ